MGIIWYEVKASCQNCGEYFSVNILKGRTIKEHFDSKKVRCKNCGCTTTKHETEELEESVSDIKKWFKPGLK